MNDVITYTEVDRLNYDPTRTTALRNSFATDMNRRFKAIAAAIVISVFKNDCLGLNNTPIHVFQATPINPNAFLFLHDSKIFI